MTSFLSHSAKETQDFAKDFAKRILSDPLSRKNALVIGLRGELGAGKTTFVQGFAKGFGIKGRILSPTFLILKNFTMNNVHFKTLYHIDCYRIETPKELLQLGFQKIIMNPYNIVIIEWAQKIQKILPTDTHWIQLTVKDSTTRAIRVH